MDSREAKTGGRISNREAVGGSRREMMVTSTDVEQQTGEINERI